MTGLHWWNCQIGGDGNIENTSNTMCQQGFLYIGVHLFLGGSVKGISWHSAGCDVYGNIDGGVDGCAYGGEDGEEYGTAEGSLDVCWCRSGVVIGC
jgi:hypothetical protein